MEENPQDKQKDTTPSNLQICIAGHLTKEEIQQIDEATRYFVLSLRLHKIYEEMRDGKR